MPRYIVLILLATLSACAGENERSKERVRFWTEAAAREIPVGSRKAQIEQWARSKSIEVHENASEHKLFATAEIVQGDGLVCSQWNIVIEISTDDAGVSTAQNVHSVGTCL